MGNILDKAGLKTFATRVKTAIANAVAEVKLYFTTQKVTWSELKALRDAKKLVAGKTYRITDFVTTTAQADTRSAGHAFDILVVADDAGTLNENARAVLHSGDTYFAQSDLSAWRLMYCLDNDDTRFAWADTENGKGVIFRMIDEWENDVPYDFKNIQFKLYAAVGQGWEDWLNDLYGTSPDEIIPYRVTADLVGVEHGGHTWEKDDDDFIWAYTWSSYENDKTTTDKSLGVLGAKDSYDDVVHDCEIGCNWETLQKDDESAYSRLSLNRYVAIPFYRDTKDESFRTYGIKMGINCHDIVTGRKCYSWTCGNNCYSWTCGNSCAYWTCGNNCYSWTCGNSCAYWTCGNDCNSWTCGNSCSFWTCGNSCAYWTCGNDCNSWTCGNSCTSWTCGNSCAYWTCGNDCSFWTCGNDCNSWTCGNSCADWTCGNDCNSWTCGNSCSFWTCGNSCADWTCGNDCNSWTCGNSCSFWTCGNFVNDVSIPQNNVSYFHLASGTRYVNIRSNGTPTGSTPLQNFEVKGGIVGDSDSSRVDIVIPTTDFPLGAQYTWTIAKNSKGEIKQYCEADLIN